ncbi:nuclear pore membrane glycoprotein 210 [Ischnura elegans]|uniref:nuclear pore membrane glycoprotein 210 n=1 Tax=Ischnura elegans TaxID=197161 RepID=UPI001ED875A0|nr:nuclear pore membrane glycoprotein 210 [Ischnura elegans]
MARIFLNCIYVAIALTGAITDASKLNVPRVLLPLFSQLSTNFTLEVTEGGCYKWATSRPDVVSLSPLDVDQRLGCSSVAIVRSASAQDGGAALTGRATAIVLAEEVHSGLVLRCDVIVDAIHSLSIVTTTRELFVEEAPEAFEVRAYDDQGNEFSTLEGVAFEWSIGGQKREKASGGGPEETAGGSVLRFITYRDSPYEAPHGVELLESRGLRANTVLLEGMKTGSAKVSVRLPRQQGSAIRGGLPASVASAPSVPPVEVTLVVVANLLIDPPDIYVMPGCTIHYRVLQMKQGRLEEIPMPSEQYVLELDQEGEEIAVIDIATNVVTAKRVGRTHVTLKDRYVDAAVQEGGGRGIPTAHLKVGLPASLSLSVLPHRNWALTLGKEYELSVEVLDVGGRRLMVPHDGPLHVATKVPTTIFSLSGSTKNGTWHWGEASALGTAPVSASIDMPKEWASAVAPARAEMRVFRPVELIPPEVVLPCVGTVVEMQMKASGGDGNYVWTSTGGGGLVSLAQSGLLSVAPGECGLTFTAEVSVAMARNGHNRDAAKVWVLPMEHLEITERVIEAEVGAQVPLNVAIFSVDISKGKTREGVPFSDCRSLPFSVRVWDEEKFEQAEDCRPQEPSGNACIAIMMKSKMPGTTKVTVASGKMDDTCIMVAYEPLKVVQPPTGAVILAVGTSSVIRFEGGPRPLPGRPAAEHVREIEFILPPDYDDSEEGYLVDAMELGEESEIAGGIYTYRVFCRKLGEGELRLTVFNSPSGSLGSKSSAAVSVICSPPTTISLGIVHPKESMHSSLARPCPIDPMAGRAVSHYLQDTNLEAVILDHKGRKFDNVTSIVLEWQLSSNSLGQLKDSGSSGLDTLRMLHPLGKTGTLDVSCRIKEYRMSHFRSMGLPLPLVSLDCATQATITIVLVSEARIAPNHSVLFNHPSSGSALKIYDGSGHFELVKSAFEFADTQLVTESPKGGGLVKISPKSPGTLHLSIVDLCLPGMSPATAEVHIFGIASIEAEVPDKVELGRSINATVRFTDTLGRTLPSPIPDPRRVLGFKSIPASDLIGVAPAVAEKSEKSSEGALTFTVSGLALGDTTLAFSIANAGTQAQSVVSAAMPIQVFPPLRLHPRSLILVPGAIFQIDHSGGPRPDPGIEFRMGGEFGSSSVATVGPMGLVEALAVGSASVWGRATLAPPSASQESVEVRVVSLVGMRVKAPIARLCVGCRMPAWAEGVGQGGRGRPVQVSPLILGSVRPAPEYSWSAVPHDIIGVHGVFSALGIEGRDADRVSVRLHGLHPGRATIHLRVTLPALPNLWTAGGVLEDSIEVEVFEEMSLVLPPPPPLGADHRFGRPLLMAPGATLQLRTNKESMDGASVSYKLVPGGKESTVIKLGPGGIVSSSSEFGKSAVMATFTEPSGSQQSIVIAIEVKPIHYMMLTLKGAGESCGLGEECVGAEDGLLPRGLPLNLRVSYHDDTGAMFSAARRNLHFRTNRVDLMRISHGDGNDTLVVDVIESGETMLKVWGEGGGTAVEKEGESQVVVVPPVMDYVKLHVGEVILPAKPVLTVGDIVCFRAATLLAQPPAAGRRVGGPWKVLPLSGVGGRSVGEGDILRLDERTGVGKAVGPGQALVRLQLTASGGTTSTEVDVRPIESIVFLSSGGPGNLTNSHRDIPFKVPLVLLGPDDSALAKRSNVIPSPSEVWGDKEGRAGDSVCGMDSSVLRPYPFRCVLQFSEKSHPPLGVQVTDIFTVRSGFDPTKGVYVCEITPSGGSSAVEVATLQVNFILRVMAVNPYQSAGAPLQPDHGSGSSLQVSQGSFTSSQPLLLPFYPAVIVQPLSIQLSNSRPSANLFLTGSPSVLEQVEVHVCDESVLQVESAPPIGSSSMGVSVGSSSSFTIHLKKAYWLSNELTRPLYITVISEFTHQRIEVPVKVRLSEGDGAEGVVQAPCIASHINTASFSFVDFVIAYRNSFILVLSTVVIVLVTLYAYTMYIEPMVARQRPVTMTYSPRQQQPASHGSPLAQSPLLRVAPPGSEGSSPGYAHRSPYSELSPEPVYGAVSGSYYQSPSLRRNRKFL